MVFLSCVNETMHLLWNLPFFKMVLPKTNLFLLSNLGLIIAQQTSIHINCFMAGGMTHLVPSYLKNAHCGRGALRCLSYLINNFLTDIKQLSKASTGVILHPPSNVYVRASSVPFSL